MLRALLSLSIVCFFLVAFRPEAADMSNSHPIDFRNIEIMEYD